LTIVVCETLLKEDEGKDGSGGDN